MSITTVIVVLLICIGIPVRNKIIREYRRRKGNR